MYKVVISIILIGLSSLLFSDLKAQINIVQEGYWLVQDSSGVTIENGSRANQKEAIEAQLNYELNTGNKAYIKPAPIRVDIDRAELLRLLDFEGSTGIPDTSLVDTIYVGDDWTGLTNMQVVDTISRVVFKYGGVTGTVKNVLTDGDKLYITEKDPSFVIPNYVFTVELERTKTWVSAETTYKITDALFFIEYNLGDYFGDIRFNSTIPKKQSRILCESQTNDGSWVITNEFNAGKSVAEGDGFYFWFAIDSMYKGTVCKVTVWDLDNNEASVQFLAE